MASVRCTRKAGRRVGGCSWIMATCSCTYSSRTRGRTTRSSASGATRRRSPSRDEPSARCLVALVMLAFDDLQQAAGGRDEKGSFDLLQEAVAGEAAAARR